MDLALLIEAVLLLEAKESEKLPAGWKAQSRYLTGPEKDNARKDLITNFLRILKTLPKDEDFEAAAKAGEAKKGWYARSAKAIHDMFGVDTPRFVAVLASTSPQVSVEENMRLAIRIWSAWVAAGRPADEDGINNCGIKAMGKTRWFGMKAWKVNATAALQSEEPEKMTLGGFKVDSFRKNLLGDLSAVTNDAWMANFALINQELFGSKAGYLAYSAKIRKVAAKLGWQPAEVQETVWSFFKALYEKSTIDNPATQSINDLKDSDIDSVPDFATQMMKDPHVKEHLDALGLGVGSGAPDLGVRDGGDKTAADRAAEGGLVGAVGRVAARAEELRQRRDTDALINNNVFLASARVVSFNATGSATLALGPDDLAKLKDKLGQRNITDLNKNNGGKNLNLMSGVIVPRTKNRWLVLNKVKIVTDNGTKVKINFSGARNITPHKEVLNQRMVMPEQPAKPAIETPPVPEPAPVSSAVA